MSKSLHQMRIPLGQDAQPSITLEYDPDIVYAPTAYSSVLLTRNLHVNDGEVSLDLCTGTGIYAISMAMRGARHIVAVDLLAAPLAAARHNAELNRVAECIDFRQGSLFDPIAAGEKFSLIVSNPPCMPDPGTTTLQLPGETMLSGSDGSHHAEQILLHAPEYLLPGGRLVFTYPSTSNPKKIFKLLDERYEFEILSQIETPFYMHFLELWDYLIEMKAHGLADFHEIDGVPYRTYWLIEALVK